MIIVGNCIADSIKDKDILNLPLNERKAIAKLLVPEQKEGDTEMDQNGITNLDRYLQRIIHLRFCRALAFGGTLSKKDWDDKVPTMLRDLYSDGKELV